MQTVIRPKSEGGVLIYIVIINIIVFFDTLSRTNLPRSKNFVNEFYFMEQLSNSWFVALSS